MTRPESLCVWISNVLVVGTGLVYGWMTYFAESDDPDAIVNHPLQPDVQHAHVLVAPLLVFAIGLVWRAHVWTRVRSGHLDRRVSGLVLFAMFLPMTASGYLLQTAVEPAWRELWTWIHVATSLAWTLAFLVHQIERRVARPSRTA